MTEIGSADLGEQLYAGDESSLVLDVRHESELADWHTSKSTSIDGYGYDAVPLTDGTTGWSRGHRNAPVAVDIDEALIQVARPGKGCPSHVLLSDGEAVFDPCHHVEEYEAIIDDYEAEFVAVFGTHAHADHV